MGIASRDDVPLKKSGDDDLYQIVLQRFQDWLDRKAPKYESLEELLKWNSSESKLRAKIARGLLFIVFILDVLNLRGRDTKVKETEKTTDEIARELLKDIETQQLAQLEIAEVFLNQMQEQTGKKEESLTEDMQHLRQQEKVVFSLFVLAASLTIVVVVVGIVLIFLKYLAFGVVAEAVGILPGTGTLILNRLAKRLTEQRERLSKSREDSLKDLQAIHVTLLIPDRERRNEGIISLASRLRDRAMKSG